MRFIVDAQLPKTLSDFLSSKGFDSIHTLELPDQNKTKDGQISKLAISENRIVITKDLDFLESFLVKGEPRKLILIKTGNISNSILLRLIETNLEIITEMISRSNLIEISKNEIAEHD